MKKYFLILIIFAQTHFYALAQINLVPNYSFENYSSCPPEFNSIGYMVPWFQPNYPYAGINGSSDVKHQCGGNVPWNNFTFQYARTGIGYAGIQLYFYGPGINEDKYREYIEVALTDSLKNNKKYCVRFFVNKGDLSGYPVKQIQAVLTNDSLLYNDPEYKYITGVTPILEADSIINDTLNWVPVQTTYTATGGEKFLTIGNFTPGAIVDYLYTWPYGSGSNTGGYYLFDDISIYELPDYNAGADDTICPWHSTVIGPQAVRADVQYNWSPTTGLDNPNIANPTASPMINTTYVLTVTDTSQWACNSILQDTITITVDGCIGVNEFEKLNSNFRIYPNPANKNVFIETGNANSILTITDVLGRTIMSLNISHSKTEISVADLPEGVYIFKIVVDGELNETKRLVIAR